MRNKTPTFLNYVLSARQDAIVNYFIPSVVSFWLYVFLIASDVAVVFRHYKEDNGIWAGLTIFCMFLPAILSYVIIISSWDLWPEKEGCGRDNTVWFIVKTIEHLSFPIWATWRYAERIFWSFESLRSNDEKTIIETKKLTSAPRTIELYFFLQAFLHSLPQILLQLNILMRQNYKVNQQNADAEILSFVFNLTKVSMTVAFYQRFKTQKLAGREYPWFKSYKYPKDEVDFREKFIEDVKRNPVSESRRSSDFYLDPSDENQNATTSNDEITTLRETSIIDGPKRAVFKEVSEPDFNIKRVQYVKALPEDDLAGKLVSFCWWACFLLARILAISASFYFNPTSTFWLLCSHFIIVLTFLLYDVKSDDVKKSKALFFIFIGFMYIFCIIEFKIKFKKVKFMYAGYFVMVFIENFIMCGIWYTKNLEELENDFWFRYIFYIVILGTLGSVTAMLLYLSIYKPKKIVIGRQYVPRSV